MKRRGSSETRFPKVWCRSELCSRGKLPFEVSKNFRNEAVEIIALLKMYSEYEPVEVNIFWKIFF